MKADSLVPPWKKQDGGLFCCSLVLVSGVSGLDDAGRPEGGVSFQSVGLGTCGV